MADSLLEMVFSESEKFWKSNVDSLLAMSRPYDQAYAEMKLTGPERALYERHLANLSGPGGVRHPDGSVSTLYQMAVEGPGGLTYNIPSVYGGKIVSPERAIANAARQGWQVFPSYPTLEEAESRYGQMHKYMERDVRR